MHVPSPCRLLIPFSGLPASARGKRCRVASVKFLVSNAAMPLANAWSVESSVIVCLADCSPAGSSQAGLEFAHMLATRTWLSNTHKERICPDFIWIQSPTGIRSPSPSGYTGPIWPPVYFAPHSSISNRNNELANPDTTARTTGNDCTAPGTGSSNPKHDRIILSFHLTQKSRGNIDEQGIL